MDQSSKFQLPQFISLILALGMSIGFTTLVSAQEPPTSAESKTEAKTESKTEPKTESKTESKTEAKTEAKTESKTEVEAKNVTHYQPPPAKKIPKIEGSALIIPIHGTIDLGLPPFLERSLARHPEAKVIILEVDTLGGRVDAAIKIRDTLLRESRPVIAFIDRRAISAGALISYAADYLIFSEGATMGAATPIQLDNGQAKAVGEKMVSYFRSEMRATAEAHDRDGDIAEAMVDADKVVSDVSVKGKLLTLTTKEARRLRVSDGHAESIAEVIELFGLNPKAITREETSWSEDIARAVTDPTVSGILMSIGMLGIIIELYTPGIGFAGGLGFFSLLCFFFGHRVAGLAGSEEVILISVGFISLAIEIFLIPGFGLFGIIGMILIGTGFIASMGEVPTGQEWSLDYFETPLRVFVFSLIGTLVAITFLAKYLPRSRLGSWLVLNEDLSTNQTASVETYELDGSALHIKLEVGSQGITQTPLRLSGKARFDDLVYDVISRDEYLDAHVEVVVHEVSGSRIVVIALPKSSTSPDPKSA